MLSIFEYIMPLTPNFSIEMPPGARILGVQKKNNIPLILALSNVEKPTEIRGFRLAQSGHRIKEKAENLHYIGTVPLEKGDSLGHLFEISEKKSDF